MSQQDNFSDGESKNQEPLSGDKSDENFVVNIQSCSSWTYANEFVINFLSLVYIFLTVVKYVLCIKMWKDVLNCVDEAHPKEIDWDFYESGGSVLISAEIWIGFTILISISGAFHVIISQFAKNSSRTPLVRSSYFLIAGCIFAVLDFFYSWLHYFLIFNLMKLQNSSTPGIEAEVEDTKQLFNTFEDCLLNSSEILFRSLGQLE